MGRRLLERSAGGAHAEPRASSRGPRDPRAPAVRRARVAPPLGERARKRRDAARRRRALTGRMDPIPIFRAGWRVAETDDLLVVEKPALVSELPREGEPAD